MKKTLDGSNFLIRDSTIGYDRILIFTTAENLKQLKISPFWIMDRIFKIIPTIFKQLYTIHGCIGNENLCIMPLVYVLMFSKSEECYRRMFQDLIEYSEEQNIDLQPQFILTDFEKAAINTIQAELFQNILRRSENIVRHPPLFSPLLWSVTNNIKHAFPRTQNSVKAWHRRWKILRYTKTFTKKKDCEHEIRIQNVYNDQNNRLLIKYFQGIAHNILL
ncbi:uncharacterized protein LOC115034219 [Rhizophagus clarus]|uniref:Uncharacterized protein LOC115034219 n=1 Tax=Rhizophagus clarus TaxID=94130 RepID=A0A8H3L3U3_9GLOM|nr:uncharacterized protein LOC115034219 [Rhizophagus clarus]